MADRSGPIVVHPWLGSLRSSRSGELLGSLDIDPAIRPPRMNGNRDVELNLDVMRGDTGSPLAERLDQVAARIGDALGRLASIRQFTATHAPPDWVASYGSETARLADLLFLDCIEVSGEGEMALVFDFGDLDSLVARLDGHGNVVEVVLRT